MITENDYRNALRIVSKYREQSGFKNLSNVIGKVLYYYHLTKEDILSKGIGGRPKRDQNTSECRHLIMYLALLDGNTAKEAASIGGVSEHSGALYARRAVQNRMDVDKNYKQLVEQFEQML